MNTSRSSTHADRRRARTQALVVAVVDRGDDRGEDAAADEPVDLLDVVVRVRAARDARRRVEIDDPDDRERRDGDEQRPVEVLANPARAARVAGCAASRSPCPREAAGLGAWPVAPSPGAGARGAMAWSRSYSWTICIATGTATSGPEPPCSTRTVTATSGARAGAKLDEPSVVLRRGTSRSWARPPSSRRSRSARCRSCRRRRATGRGPGRPFRWGR